MSSRITSTPTTRSKEFINARLVSAEIVSGVIRQTVVKGGTGVVAWTSLRAATSVRAPGRYESLVRRVTKAYGGELAMALRDVVNSDDNHSLWEGRGGIGRLEISAELNLNTDRDQVSHALSRTPNSGTHSCLSLSLTDAVSRNLLRISYRDPV